MFLTTAQDGHYQVILILITSCFAYQGPIVTTVTPPPHRGAARIMYGSGSLRTPGPLHLGPGHRPQRQRPTPTPSNKNMRYYPIVPLPIPIRDFDTIPDGFPIMIHPGYPDDGLTIRTRTGGRTRGQGGYYGGRVEYPIGRGWDYGGYPRGISMQPENRLRKNKNIGILTMKAPSDIDGEGMMEEDDFHCKDGCERSEFTCAATCQCIKYAYRCDGHEDCEHGEDETECGELESARNEICQDKDKYVRCPRSGKCIRKDWLCDGEDDCGDFSDETHCADSANCTSDQFECANGLCIQKSWICDNDNDCWDFSDELNCTKTGCTQDEYTCSDGSCISLSWRCDREPDCNDNSDENDCDFEPPACNKGEFHCNTQKCIKFQFRCDGDNDCGDWSDEESCESKAGRCVAGELNCNNGECIPESWKCDKQQDCENGEDEVNCTDSNTRTCSPEQFTCKSGACILKTWVCDGYSDCSEDEDESECKIVCDETKFACSVNQHNNSDTEFCINKKHVCDGLRDCPKGDDEQDCPTTHDCPQGSKCAQLCVKHEDDREACSCNRGYSLAADGFSCEDVNECLYATDPVCSQTCNNTIGSFKCGCMTGYILRPDLRTCKALGASPTLLFANRFDIRQVSLQMSSMNSRYTVMLKGQYNAIALDYHYKKGLIFWSDMAMDVIKKANIVGGMGRDKTDVIKWGLESPGGIAVDWIHDLIFWTDSGTRRVEVANIEGTKRAILVANDLDKPRAIVVHPGRALVFWTDWGPRPKIERIEMDGANRQGIITESVFWPNGLTIDFTNDRIYWADAKHNVIETALYDGSDRKKVISKGLPHPFALTIFEDAIYWTDWHTKAISTANKQTGAGMRTIHANLHFPMDIHSYHPQRQPDYANHCGANNGGCEHLCLPNRNSYTCLCQMGLKLNEDQRTCQQPEKLLVFVRKKDIRIKQLDPNAAHHHEIVVPIDGIKSAVAIAWESKTDMIYWTDVEKDTINRAHWNGSNHQVVIKTNVESPAGLAYDWYTDKIYWTDDGTAKIEVSNSDGSLRGILVWEDLDRPRDIVVDPVGGYMYWSDWGEKPKIERAAMDGTMRSVVIEHKLTWPNGLAIDYDSNRLYWSDGGTSSIEYSNLDGTNRKVLLEGVSLPHPFGLDVFGDNIYWTDWETFNIERANKHTGQNRKVISTGISDLMDVRVFHRTRRYRSTPCHKNNGGCSHLCLLKPKGHACRCPIGITLTADGKTCTKGPINSLIIAHRVDIRQISLDVPYIVDVVLPFPPLKNVMSVDVDRKTGEIYWTDTSADVIQKNTPDGKHMKTIIWHELQMADGITIDSTGRKMYWTDGGRNSIEVAELDGSNRKVLIWSDLDSPRAITLHYHHGLMFWSDWGTKAKIEVAQMDGSNRRALITTKLEWPNGLAIDRPAGRLYWNDGKLKTIESSDLNGKDRRVIIVGVPHPYGLVVVGNHMYWTDWQTQGLHRAEKTNGSDRAVIRDKLEGLMDVRSVQSDNIAENACGNDNGGCSHLCLRNAKGFACACPTGIKFKHGSTKLCEYQPTTYLMFATRSDIVRISLDTEDLFEVTLPIRRLHHVIDVDFHWKKQLIFISDVDLGRIQSINMKNFTDRRDVLSDNTSIPHGIAVDWISDIIYWTDGAKNQIELANINGSLRRVVIKDGLQEPRSIAVFPRRGYLFWTDWGNNPKIERSYLDGSERKVLFDNDLGFPNGLVIDYKAKRLYWADSKWDRVETADLHGRNRIQLVQHNGNAATTHPFAVAQFENYIYWTDWLLKTIVRADKSSGKKATVMKGNLDGAMGIRVVAESRQKGWNPCAIDNGGCTHLCLFRQADYICKCPDQLDGKPCKIDPISAVPLKSPDDDEYVDEPDDDYDPNGVDFDEGSNDLPTHSSMRFYVMIFVPIVCFIVLGVALFIAFLLYKKTRKKLLYATGRSVMTFSNPNYYTSNPAETPTAAANVDKKPFLWKRLKYDKSQERVYEDKGGCSSPEVTSLIPTVLTPCSSHCEAITPELERSPSITPLRRNSLNPVV